MCVFLMGHQRPGWYLSMILLSTNVDFPSKSWGHKFDHIIKHKGIKEEQADGVTKVLEEVVMTAIKLCQQQEQGHGAVL